ncbi:MAG TPA: phosphoglycerate kinase [Nitrospiraceae bacterium]|nr:MAG: phosphoglycerate kinase [Nitrospirae bacterium GWA2_42_11]HBI23360.1 phosphoglycerate kinase [Nitrospiraceae bacterium]
MPSKLTIKDIDIRNRRVFIRVDFNVPLNTELNITDDTRIRYSLPTINYAIDEGAKVILASHLGRPKGKRNPALTMSTVVKRLQRLLNKDVIFLDDCIGPEVEKVVNSMESGEVVLLENLRFYPGEESNDDSFAKQLSQLGDVYVNDAFGTSHRSHASITGVPKYVRPAVVGFLVKKEVEYIEGVMANPVRPFVAILGGAKVSGKLGMIENLEEKVDKVIIGGGMAFTFLKAMGYEVGNSLVEPDMIDISMKIYKKAWDRGIRFYLPVDCVVAPSMDPGAETMIVPTQEIPKDWKALDIGPASVKLFTEALANARTILWNGPMGVFEIDAFSRGTFAIAHAIAESYALTIVGGGDTANAVDKARESENMSFISTGGGAVLQLLEGKPLQGIVVLDDKEDKE